MSLFNSHDIKIPPVIAVIVGICIFGMVMASYTPYSQQQADWGQLNSGLSSYIQNKPNTANWDSAYSNQGLYYNRSGRIFKQIKHWVDTLIPTTATGQTLDISSAGFMSVTGCTYFTIGTDAYPIWIKTTTQTNTLLTFNISQPNTNLVNILGSLVLLGNSYVNATNLPGIKIKVDVTGY